MSQPSIEKVISNYLYKKDTPPSDFSEQSLIRAPGDDARIEIDVSDYMANGAGRFAYGANINIIQVFFEGTFHHSALFHKYVSKDNPSSIVKISKQDVAAYFGFDSYGLVVDQKDWDDGKGNYAERSYIWGNTSFQINDAAEFVIEKSQDAEGQDTY